MKNKVQNIEALAQTKFLSLYNANYINKGGNKKTWTIATRKSKEALEDQFFNGKEDKVDAVVILAYHKDEKKLVAIKQFRMPINNYVYELPAGLIDNNDDIISTVKRELKEETGLDLEEVIENKIGQKLYLSPGMTDESVSLVYCTCSGKISDENLEEDEDIETILLSKEDAIKIPTVISAGAVTADVTTDNNPEQNNITKKHNAVNTEVNPVRPPASTPVNDSTNEVVEDVPNTDPITVAVESANNALSPSTK